MLGARVLGEFGDDPNRYTTAKSRKNYAGTSPLTVASGKKRAVLARHVRNRRLYDAIDQWAFCALTDQPRRPRLLRPAPRRRRPPPPSPTRPRQPPRRHPARLPTPPHPLRRTHSLGTPPTPPQPLDNLRTWDVYSNKRRRVASHCRSHPTALTTCGFLRSLTAAGEQSVSRSTSFPMTSVLGELGRRRYPERDVDTSQETDVGGGVRAYLLDNSAPFVVAHLVIH